LLDGCFAVFGNGNVARQKKCTPTLGFDRLASLLGVALLFR
jgi:hypothetical protein